MAPGPMGMSMDHDGASGMRERLFNGGSSLRAFDFERDELMFREEYLYQQPVYQARQPTYKPYYVERRGF